MSNKIICSCCKEKIATWCYMPGYANKKSYLDDYSCDDCVPRGCSCNEESMNYFEQENDVEELNYQAEQFRFEFNENPTRNIYLTNYGKREHNRNKEIEIIKDKNLIKSIINNVSNEQLLHFSITPLDENGKEYPCCEYWYEENGWEDKGE